MLMILRNDMIVRNFIALIWLLEQFETFYLSRSSRNREPWQIITFRREHEYVKRHPGVAI